jgi:hypothetical protein
MASTADAGLRKISRISRFRGLALGGALRVLIPVLGTLVYPDIGRA